MRIIVQFLGGTQYWQDKITANAAQASAILSDPAFIAKIRAWPGFDFTGETPDQIADKIQNAGEVTIKVGFYSKWWTRAIAYEQDGAVYFNTRKESYGAGSKGNIAHEVTHALGYEHNGNAAAGNLNTVPYRIGEWADA